MNSTQKRLSAKAWSMLESLSNLRKSVQQEMGFIQSVSPDIPLVKFEEALISIDDFSDEISRFLADIKYKEGEGLQDEFEGLADRHELLIENTERLLGR